MKQRTLAFFISLFVVGGIFAQTLPEGMVSLLPSGVRANINDVRKLEKHKNLVVAGEKTKGYLAFFAAADDAHGEELWVTDGTAAGTHLVKDINPGPGSSDVNWMSRFNDKVVFAATDGQNGMQLWISDGTEAGTYMVKQIHDFGDSNPRGFTQVNENQFVFLAMDFESESFSERGPQSWLWVSDGTEAGTRLIFDCDMKWPGQDNTSPYSPYMRVARRVFFKADNNQGTVGEELWVTDGTTAGTKFVKDINTETIATGTANSAIDNMVNFYNEKLFLKAFSIESSNEPWASDGTEEGTYEIFDSNPTHEDSGFPRGGGASDMGQFPYKGKVYFRGFTLDTGTELAATNLDKGDFTIWDIQINEPTDLNNSYPDPGVEFDGVYMFCANSGADPEFDWNKGGELHYTDGENVYLQSDLGPGVLHSWQKELTVVSGSLYWWNESGNPIEHRQKLFRIDNKESIPVRVTDFDPDGDRIHTLRNLGGNLIFARNDEDRSLYCYHYRKPDYDPAVDTDKLDIEYRTRKEIEDGVYIEKFVANGQMVIYPNPATENFQFLIEGEAVSVNIFDMSGRLIQTDTQLKGNVVNVSKLKSGIYNVVVTNTNSSYVSKLIIK